MRREDTKKFMYHINTLCIYVLQGFKYSLLQKSHTVTVTLSFINQGHVPLLL